jgi:hypothetical protein
MVAIASLLSADGTGQFPVQRAQEEFAKLAPFVLEYCGANQGNVEMFRRAAQPFGPMDLMVTKGSSREAEILRNLYVGFAGAACKVNAAALARSFHCGKGCTADRRSDLLSRLEAIKGVVKQFVALAGVDLISQWGIVREFRVNNLFTIMRQTNEAVASHVMGFIPSDNWKGFPSVADFLKAKGISETAFADLLGNVKKLSLAAVVRERQAIRVVRVGIADNESGLLFLDDDQPLPTVGAMADGGRRYVVIEKIEKNIVFYETD